MERGRRQRGRTAARRTGSKRESIFTGATLTTVLTHLHMYENGCLGGVKAA